jgi:hypothetical protein
MSRGKEEENGEGRESGLKTEEINKRLSDVCAVFRAGRTKAATVISGCLLCFLVFLALCAVKQTIEFSPWSLSVLGRSQEKETAMGESQDLIMFDHANNKIEERDVAIDCVYRDRKREVSCGCLYGSMVAIGCRRGGQCLCCPLS